MSGARRKTKYRKGVVQACLHDLPEPEGVNELVVRVVVSRGGNVVEVETADGEIGLCRLPQKFKKVVWVKRGSLLIVERAATAKDADALTKTTQGGAMCFVVKHILFADQIKHLKDVGMLPAMFDVQPSTTAPPIVVPVVDQDEEKSVTVSQDDSEDIFAGTGNVNRRGRAAESSSSSDEDDEDDDDNADTAEDKSVIAEEEEEQVTQET